MSFNLKQSKNRAEHGPSQETRQLSPHVRLCTGGTKNRPEINFCFRVLTHRINSIDLRGSPRQTSDVRVLARSLLFRQNATRTFRLLHISSIQPKIYKEFNEKKLFHRENAIIRKKLFGFRKPQNVQ